jgi:hypothetical protein
VEQLLPLRRAELEVRLLAGQGDATIAARTGLSPAAVAAFHDVFFAVRPRLGAGVYVLSMVLGGGRVFYAPDPDDHGLLLKLFGYHMGGPSPLHKRYLDKLGRQEDEVEKYRAKVKKLQAQEDARKQALDDFLAAFSAG